MLHQLNLPQYQHRIEQREEKQNIFDIIRKKWVILTPEEWVRQNLLQYLILDKNYPKQRTAVEETIVVNNMNRRCDIIIYDKEIKPFIVVECKAPEVKITQKAFDQIAAYNWTLQAKYLIVSNGETHFFCMPDYQTGKYSFMREIPQYKK